MHVSSIFTRSDRKPKIGFTRDATTMTTGPHNSDDDQDAWTRLVFHAEVFTLNLRPADQGHPLLSRSNIVPVCSGRCGVVAGTYGRS